jgi:hypothetical protein
MRNALGFLLLFTVAFLPLSFQPPKAWLTGEKEILGQRVIEPSLAGAAGRFVDNGDGTVTDRRRKLMWQKGDNGKEVSFAQAQQYCKNLRLGGHADWRLPRPDEGETAVAVELMKPIHSPDTYARFDLYWSSDPTVLLPFNYRPSRGREVLRAYPARGNDRAFVRAVRSLR